MVNMDRVLGELKRTGYVGLGVFGSTLVGNFMDDFVPGGDLGVAAGQYAVGTAGAYYATEEMGTRSTRGLGFDVGEMVAHTSRGVGGAGFAEAADMIRSDQTGALSNTVQVKARGNAGSSQTGQSTSEDHELSIDV